MLKRTFPAFEKSRSLDAFVAGGNRYSTANFSDSDENLAYQGVSYIEIWCKFAHQLYVSNHKTLIPHYIFERIRQPNTENVNDLHNYLAQNINQRNLGLWSLWKNLMKMSNKTS